MRLGADELPTRRRTSLVPTGSAQADQGGAIAAAVAIVAVDFHLHEVSLADVVEGSPLQAPAGGLAHFEAGMRSELHRHFLAVAGDDNGGATRAINLADVTFDHDDPLPETGLRLARKNGAIPPSIRCLQ